MPQYLYSGIGTYHSSSRKSSSSGDGDGSGKNPSRDTTLVVGVGVVGNTQTIHVWHIYLRLA